MRFNKLSSNSRLVLSPAADRTSTTEDFRMMFPCTIFHKGRVDEKLTLYTDNLSARKEWQQKLEEAIGLRVAVSESDKVRRWTFSAPMSVALTPQTGIRAGADRRWAILHSRQHQPAHS